MNFESIAKFVLVGLVIWIAGSWLLGIAEGAVSGITSSLFPSPYNGPVNNLPPPPYYWEPAYTVSPFPPRLPKRGPWGTPSKPVLWNGR